MGRQRLFLAIAGSTFLLSPACGGGTAYREGRKAELHKDWDTALIDYQRALETQPENAKYIIREHRARFEASQFHLRRGRSLAASGKRDEAAGEFQKAASIDPTNEAASQELTRLLAAEAAAKRARDGSVQQALKAREEAAQPIGPQLKPLPQEPMHIKIPSTDSRKVFETLAKLADLNVAFTSDFTPKPVSVDLSDVKIEDALHIVAYQTKSFWKVVTSNTILVIPDTPSNRRDYADEVVKTVYLSNPLTAADRTAITTALKQILGMQRIVDNPDSNAIILRDEPDRVAEAEKLIHDLDQGKAEILIEVTVVEADRNRIRDLGLTPATITPTGSVTPGLAAAGVFNPLAAATTTGGTSAQSSAVTADAFTGTGALANIIDKYYAVVLPSAAASAILNDSHTHIIQTPQVRVTDGTKATLRIGSRIPYATGSFLPALGGVSGGGGTGFGLLASTSFQFQDVGVNLDLTPRLLPDGEIGVHAVIDISSLGTPASFGGGLQEPTFNQRKIEHDIRMKEGEVSLLGGLIQSTETQAVAGVPFLGQIPGLRYLFSTEHRERLETEVLVMLTPRLIRLPEISLAAGRGLNLGGKSPSEPVPPPEGPIQGPVTPQ